MSRVTSTEPALIPEDVYNLICIDYDVKSGQHGDYIVWNFEVADGEYQGTRANCLTSNYLSPESKLNKLLQSFGFPSVPGKGYEVELDHCRQETIRGVVGPIADKNDPEKKYNTVTSYLAKTPDKQYDKKEDISVPTSNDLPEGWTVHIDQRSGKTYYYNEKTKKSQWEKPVKQSAPAPAPAPTPATPEPSVQETPSTGSTKTTDNITPQKDVNPDSWDKEEDTNDDMPF